MYIKRRHVQDKLFLLISLLQGNYPWNAACIRRRRPPEIYEHPFISHPPTIELQGSGASWSAKRKEGSSTHKPTNLVLWGQGRNRVSRPRLDTSCGVNPLISWEGSSQRIVELLKDMANKVAKQLTQQIKRTNYLFISPGSWKRAKDHVTSGAGAFYSRHRSRCSFSA